MYTAVFANSKLYGLCLNLVFELFANDIVVMVVNKILFGFMKLHS